MQKTLLIIAFSIFSLSLVAQNCNISIIKFQPSGECEGKDIQLIASPVSPGKTYSWNCPNSAYNNTTGPFLFIPYSCLNDLGNYTLTATDTNGCVATANIAVNVIPKPLVYISGQGFACQGTQTALYANDLSGNFSPYTYNWDNGGSTQSIKILHNGGIAPHPSCTVTNFAGCSASNQTSFMIGTIYPPDAAVSYTGLTSFCSPSSLQLEVLQGSQLSYQWRKSGKNIIGATSPTYKASVTGRYRVIVTDINGCADTSEIVDIVVFPRPAAIVTANGPTTFCNGDSVKLSTVTGNGYIYKWRKNGSNIVGANSSSFVAKQPGNYKVEVTNEFDCVRLSDKTTVAINCREEEYANIEELGISAFPNPSNTEFTLKINTLENEHFYLSIYDISGKEVESFAGDNTRKEISVGSNLPAGIYAARITRAGPGLVKVVRLVKN